MMSSISEQSQTYSFFFKPVPANPSSRSMYSFSLATTTFAATMFSKLRNSVRRSRPLPYFAFSRSNQSMVYETIFLMLSRTRDISSSRERRYSLALSALNLRIRAILISRSFRMSSRVTSLRSPGLKGSSRLSTWAMAISSVSACSNSLSLYIRFSIKIFSREVKCHASSSSFILISSSSLSSCNVASTDFFRISETIMK